MELNRDFVDSRLSPEEVKALLLVWQAGGMSFETFHHNLMAGELTRPGVTVEIERHAIDAGNDADFRDDARDEDLSDDDALTEDADEDRV